jgi:hypothetical protein
MLRRPETKATDRSDLRLPAQDIPGADRQYCDQAQLVSQVHQKIHSHLELHDAHVETGDFFKPDDADGLLPTVT